MSWVQEVRDIYVWITLQKTLAILQKYYHSYLSFTDIKVKKKGGSQYYHQRYLRIQSHYTVVDVLCCVCNFGFRIVKDGLVSIEASFMKYAYIVNHITGVSVENGEQLNLKLSGNQSESGHNLRDQWRLIWRYGTQYKADLHWLPGGL